MPIYAYRCSECGFTKDALQKVSDAALTDCPACGKSTFSKQLTAAGFQLKGTGWYVTDFKNGQQKPATTPAAGSATTPAATSAASTTAPSSDSGGASAAAGETSAA